MPATPQKGGVVPQSDKSKAEQQAPQDTRALKGGVVPQSRSFSPAEDSPDLGTTTSPAVQRQAQSQSPSPVTSTSFAPEAAVDQYAGWQVLGLEIDSKDPLIQRELRVHPTSGEVVRVPVGKAVEAGESPTPATVSQLREAGFGGPSPAPGSVGETAVTQAPTIPTSTTTTPQPKK